MFYALKKQILLIIPHLSFDIFKSEENPLEMYQSITIQLFFIKNVFNANQFDMYYESQAERVFCVGFSCSCCV